MLRLVRILIAITLLWAAWDKVVVPADGPTLYQQGCQQYPAIRYVLPGIEVFAAIWLLSGIKPQWSAIAMVALFSAFTGLIIADLAQAHPLPCGCFGDSAKNYEPATVRWMPGIGLLRNILIMAGAGVIFWRSARFVVPQEAKAQEAKGG